MVLDFLLRVPLVGTLPLALHWWLDKWIAHYSGQGTHSCASVGGRTQRWGPALCADSGLGLGLRVQGSSRLGFSKQVTCYVP